MGQKRGEGKQRFSKGGQAGSRGECLKKGGWNLLTNYVNNKRKNMKKKTTKV